MKQKIACVIFLIIIPEIKRLLCDAQVESYPFLFVNWIYIQ